MLHEKKWPPKGPISGRVWDWIRFRNWFCLGNGEVQTHDTIRVHDEARAGGTEAEWLLDLLCQGDIQPEVAGTPVFTDHPVCPRGRVPDPAYVTLADRLVVLFIQIDGHFLTPSYRS